MKRNSAVTFFKTAAQFRKWLENNHSNTHELWVGYYKKGSEKESITWPESVAQALCYGWIDGIRHSLDEISYTIRFTPRRSNSHWSSVNINMMKELQKSGQVTPSGLAAFEKRNQKNSENAAHEQKGVQLPAVYVSRIKSNSNAWAYFKNLPPSYKKMSIWWVISAKKEETQLRRLNILIESCEEGKKIPLIRKKGE